MSEINIAPGKLDVGAVFSQAFATLQSKLLFFVFTGLMVGVADLAVAQPGAAGGSSGLLQLVGFLLTVVVGGLGQILTARATSGPLGADAGMGVLIIAGTTLLVTLLVFLGLIVLVVPGLILGVMLLVATVACILEDRDPVAALQRSRELTRGNRWRLVGLLLIVVLLALGMGLAVAIPTLVAGIVPGLGALVARLVSSAAEGLLTVFIAILVTHTFLDLRRLHEASAPAPLV